MTKPLSERRRKVRASRDRQVREFLLGLADNPLQFVSLCWPEMKLYGKQRDILVSLAEDSETFVHAANEMGKSRVAALGAVWFFSTRDPVRVVVSSSSEQQVRSIIWTEIKGLIKSSVIRLPIMLQEASAYKILPPGPDGRSDLSPLSYMKAHVTKTVENFQGHHLPHDIARVLAIFDEASGISDLFNEAADSWCHRKLVIGNPLSNTNFFFRLCDKGDVKHPEEETPGLLRRVIHIDGLDSPNVQAGLRLRARGSRGSPPILIPGLLSHGEWLKRGQEWDEVQRTTRLRGRFYRGQQAMMFPPDWIDAAKAREKELKASGKKRRARGMGIDVAMGGRDLTVWTIVDEFGIIAQYVLDTPDTTEIPKRTIALMNEYKLPPSCVAMDLGGGGKQLVDRLKEMGHEIRGIHFGESAGSDIEDETERNTARKSFTNKRAEMYGHLRSRLNSQIAETPFSLPCDDQLLIEELEVLPLQYDTEGRLKLLPKEKKPDDKTAVCLRDLLRRSPDRADALVLATWAAKVGDVGPYAAITTPEAAQEVAKRSQDFAELMQTRLAQMSAVFG